MPFFGVPIRNGLPIGLGSVAGFGVQQFDPLELFASGANGVWYDPSDTSTLFQDPAGTTPVTAVEQPVGLMLDKSKGLVLGPTVISNGDFSNGTTGWIADSGCTFSVAGGVLTTTTTADSTFAAQQNGVYVVGKSYSVTFTYKVNNSTTARLRSGGTVLWSETGSLVNKTVTAIVFPTTTQFEFGVSGGTVTEFEISNISVRELPGNHAISYNATTARPTLSARVNLLTYSEDFATTWLNSRTAVTVNTTAAPDGSITADTIAEDNQTGATGRSQPVSTVAGVSYTFSCFLKNIDRRYVQLTVYASASANYISAAFDLVAQTSTTAANGTGYSVTSASVVDVGNGWFRCSITGVVGTTPAVAAAVSPRPDATAGGVPNYAGTTLAFYAWGADLRPANIGSAVPSYQRIAAATNYDTDGFPKYLYFAGVDDGMSTPANLDLTSTDKATVFAGVRKLQTSGVLGVISEFSSNWNTNNGSFYAAVEDSTTWRYAVGARGTAAVAVAQVAFTTSSTYNSPTTNVLSSSNDIAGDSTTLQLNGAPVATATGDKGSGNFGSYPLYIGSRNNASAWFNGYLYGLTVVGAQLTTPQIESMETWTAQRTGITL